MLRVGTFVQGARGEQDRTVHWPKILILELIGGGRGQNHPQVWISLQIMITDFCSKGVGGNLTAKNGFRGQNSNFKAPKKTCTSLWTPFQYINVIYLSPHTPGDLKNNGMACQASYQIKSSWGSIQLPFISSSHALEVISSRLEHTESHHPRSSLQDNTFLLIQKRRLRKATCANWMSPITPPSASPEQIYAESGKDQFFAILIGFSHFSL